MNGLWGMLRRSGDSFAICVEGAKAGVSKDFAGGVKGSSNLLDLWMLARNLDFITAMKEAGEWLGVSEVGVCKPSREASQKKRWTPYQLSDDEVGQCVAMAEALLKDEGTVNRIAKARNWKPETIGDWRSIPASDCMRGSWFTSTRPEPRSDGGR